MRGQFISGYFSSGDFPEAFAHFGMDKAIENKELPRVMIEDRKEGLRCIPFNHTPLRSPHPPSVLIIRHASSGSRPHRLTLVLPCVWCGEWGGRLGGHNQPRRGTITLSDSPMLAAMHPERTCRPEGVLDGPMAIFCGTFLPPPLTYMPTTKKAVTSVAGFTRSRRPCMYRHRRGLTTRLHRYLLTGDVTKANVATFLSDFKEGKLEPFLKSEEPPSSHDGPVKTIVGSTFQDEVSNAGKWVMLEAYAPW